jgi:hypothetical protein
MPPWYDKLLHPSLWEWGDVATWFTGIVTAGSFWLGFTILRSDRKREERSQASLLYIQSYIYVDPKKPELGQQLHIGVQNDSDRAIFLVGLSGLQKGQIERYGTIFDWEVRPRRLQPRDSIPIDYEKVKQTDLNKLNLLFADSNQVGWKYNLGRQKLSKHTIKL